MWFTEDMEDAMKLKAYKYEQYASLLCPMKNKSKPIILDNQSVTRFGLVKYYGINGVTMLAEAGGEKYAITLSEQDKSTEKQLRLIKDSIHQPNIHGNFSHAET